MAKPKTERDNKFGYMTASGFVHGVFNIYQARNGKIILVMGNGLTQLTEQQVKDLYIDVYDLQDFDYEDYKKAYS